jgi:hypothetical protein
MSTPDWNVLYISAASNHAQLISIAIATHPLHGLIHTRLMFRSQRNPILLQARRFHETVESAAQYASSGDVCEGTKTTTDTANGFYTVLVN